MGFEVLWHFNVTQENQSTRLRAVHCLRNVLCIGQLPFTSIYRLPHTTALNVTEYIKYFNLTAVTCTERHPYTGKENSYSCSVQIIRAPEISCTVHFSTDTVPGEGHCDVHNIYFIERPYTCIWYQLNMKSGEKTKIAHIHVTNYVDHGYHVSGTCTAIISQPTSGQFTYEILLLPEGLRVKAAT
ncbi:uncharacterized protein LOC112567623 [Pomacea canaliculata]|uniref:uncharacterized protein LOC112567623 n=1 Tax=Pomacea canaliculata TaxID=400727 RepID=UPI000D735E8E|nr:uncharacterized protein LOC112567623 [Pomacea canaliculata]